MPDRAEWERHFEAQKGSGLTQAEYCAREGLRANSFKDMKYKLSKRARKAGQKKAVKPSFVEISAPVLGASAEIQLGEATVRVFEGCSAETLKAVLGALEAKS